VALRPEEIIAEIRKAFPTERVTTLPRPEIPRVTAVNENLYGVPVYVYGEGFRGQYLRHGYIDRMGVRYWAIETGRVTIYGELRDGRALPLVVLGQPTHFVYEFKPRDFRRFFREEVPTGYLECQERQIINLDRAMRAEDPVIIVDKYDLLRSATPSELIERVKEYNSIIEALQRSLWEHEKVLADYRSNVSMLTARVAKLQELLAWSEERVVKLATEVTGIQTELLRLREEIRVRGAEAEALEETQRRLRDIIDRVSGLVRDLVEWGEAFKKAIERKPEKPAEGAPK
jgi:uncharacterized coiled-coil protein SlyX